jgi:hypothetical protein
VPGLSRRSGRTTSAPARTINRAGARRRAPRDTVLAERRHLDPDLLHHAGGEAPRAFLPHGLEQQIAGRRDVAAEHDDLRIEAAGEVGDRHADVFRRIAHDRDRDPVAASRPVEHVGRGDRLEVPGALEDVRAVARLNPPGQPAGDPFVADLGREAAELPIVLALDRIERQPCGGAGEAVRAGPVPAVQQDPGKHALADFQHDRVARAARRSHPALRHDCRRARRAAEDGRQSRTLFQRHDSGHLRLGIDRDAKGLDRQPGRQFVHNALEARIGADPLRAPQHRAVAIHDDAADAAADEINTQ